MGREKVECILFSFNAIMIICFQTVLCELAGTSQLLVFFINVCQFVYMRFWEWGGKANSFFIPVCLLLGFLVMYHLYFRSIVFPFRAGPLGFVACPHSHTQTSYKYTLISRSSSEGCSMLMKCISIH